MNDKDKRQHRKAELRGRWRALFEDGSIARLRSEGRLVAMYVFLVANWETCQLRIPLRRAARFMRVYPNTVRRGIQQLVEANVIECLGKQGESGRLAYRVLGGSPLVTTPVTTRDPQRTPLVTTPVTARVQSAHHSCAQGSPLVTGAHTDGDHISVSFSGSSVSTSERNSTADAGAGVGPARRRRKRWEHGLATEEAPAEPQEAKADA